MTNWRPFIEWSHPDTHAAATGATGLVLPPRYPPRKRKGRRITDGLPEQLPLPFEDFDDEENQH
jgi:hypothetical protein